MKKLVVVFALFAAGCSGTAPYPPQGNDPSGQLALDWIECASQERDDAAPPVVIDVATCREVFADLDDAGYEAGAYVVPAWQQ